MQSKFAVRLLIGVFAFTLLAACQSATVTLETPKTSCKVQSDCPIDQHCQLDSGYCVANDVDGDKDGAEQGDKDGKEAEQPDQDVTESAENADETEPADGDSTDLAEGEVELPDGAIDGDDTEQPEVLPDGDTDSEEIIVPDGDENKCATVRCVARRHCDEATGTCVYDSDHCHITGCGAGANCDETQGICVADPNSCLAKPCESHYVCNKTTGKCEVDPGLFPNYCGACANPGSCNAGNCQTDSDTRETFCAPSCVDSLCPAGATCSNAGLCLPSSGSCGLPRPIGGACAKDADCSAGEFCITEGSPDFTRTWARGYCSKTCAKSEDCGSAFENSCLQVAIANNVTTNLCLSLCNPLFSNCRQGYSCTRTSSPMVNVCMPTESVSGR